MTPSPIIPAVPTGETRPHWSVMIPTFNCAGYLRETLASVLAQDPGPEQMQIEVVDDCSTQDDPAAVVRELSPDGRVDFHRRAANGGATTNFNTCIQRSRGQLIHILHGDDFVMDRFYAEFTRQAATAPDAAIFFCRSWHVDEAGTPLFPTVSLDEREIACGNLSVFTTGNPVQAPGVVIRRSFYEQHGGFRTDLVHTADWEMWVRASATSGARFIPRVFAGYRVFEGNDTSRLRRTGENLRDIAKLGPLLTRWIPNLSPDTWEIYISRTAREQIRIFESCGDTEAAQVNRRVWRELTSGQFRRLYWMQALAIRMTASLLAPFKLEMIRR